LRFEPAPDTHLDDTNVGRLPTQLLPLAARGPKVEGKRSARQRGCNAPLEFTSTLRRSFLLDGVLHLEIPQTRLDTTEGRRRHGDERSEEPVGCRAHFYA